VSLLLLLAIVGWAIVRWDRARRTLPESRRIHAIAVLPLSNFSGDPAQDYFADGMTDEITTDLAKISSLKVISRTSAMRYRAASKPLQQIARELNVDAVVEGSVLRSGNHVRITAQLIDALNDRHLWAETYDRDMQDVLALQNEVAIAIAENVRVQLTPQEQDLLASRKPLNPGAYDAYLKGRYYYDKRSDTSMRKAAGFFRQAIALDPEYAPAYSGLADVAVTQSHYQFEAPRDVLPEARAAALKAVELDDTSAEAHASLGNLYIEEWDWTKIGPEFERAIALNPGYANAHHWYSDYLSAVGRHDEALAAEKRALELDPLSPIINTWMGRRYYQARHYEQAYAAVHEALELDPDFEPGLVHLGLICVQLKRHDEAIAVLKRAVDSSQGGLLFVALLGYAEAMGGRQQAAEKILGGLTRESKQRYVPSYMIAQIYVALGDKDHAFYWLGRAYDERSDQMMYVRIDPPLDPIRSDPRFASLIRRVNLPQ
jgi:TolB-like protein/Tfp pilus assembly protein PilF